MSFLADIWHLRIANSPLAPRHVTYTAADLGPYLGPLQGLSLPLRESAFGAPGGAHVQGPRLWAPRRQGHDSRRRWRRFRGGDAGLRSAVGQFFGNASLAGTAPGFLPEVWQWADFQLQTGL